MSYFKLDKNDNVFYNKKRYYRVVASEDFTTEKGDEILSGTRGGYIESKTILKNYGWVSSGLVNENSVIDNSVIENNSSVFNSVVKDSIISNSIINTAQIYNSSLESGVYVLGNLPNSGNVEVKYASLTGNLSIFSGIITSNTKLVSFNGINLIQVYGDNKSTKDGSPVVLSYSSTNIVTIKNITINTTSRLVYIYVSDSSGYYLVDFNGVEKEDVDGKFKDVFFRCGVYTKNYKESINKVINLIKSVLYE